MWIEVRTASPMFTKSYINIMNLIFFLFYNNHRVILHAHTHPNQSETKLGNEIEIYENEIRKMKREKRKENLFSE